MDPCKNHEELAELTADRVRLHITPFNPTLLKTYVSAPILSSVTNISYHTLETFPEKPFGYLELPALEAQKMKKKFNGTILKGTKVRVEDARPEKKRKSDDSGDIDGVEPVNAKKKKKVRAEKGEIAGVALEEGRSVKRGWTETPAEQRKSKDGRNDGKDKEGKKKREPSKYTNEPECLFHVEKLPPNVSSNVKEKKTKKKQKGVKKGEFIVHEFENTQKHASFLKSGEIDQGTKMSSEYIEGKGWVDADGNLIEAETDAQRVKRERRLAKKKANLEAKLAEQEGGFAALEREDDKVEGKAEKKARKKAEAAAADLPKEEEVPPEPARKEKKPQKALKEDEIATESKPELLPTISEKQTTPSPSKEIHPLEALYKRPKPLTTAPTQPAPIATSFNFFGSTEGTEEASPGSLDDTMTKNLPQTPFTERDLEWRGIRSAAPTPDTAAINRKFSFPMGRIAEFDNRDSEDEDDDHADVENADAEMGDAEGLGITNGTASGAEKGDGKEKEESEFSKWFWENRGDTNRAWKKRRREAMKIKRKRENRRLTRRVV